MRGRIALRKRFEQNQVERVVLNALAKAIAALPPNNLRRRRLRLPSVRAGLAFSGEADPPTTITAVTMTTPLRCSPRVVTAAISDQKPRYRGGRS
jgi:hypothetical protein